MKKPNLFIVGAPKCGTTSVASWLAQHPRVFVCEPKEPNYFSFDLTKTHQKSESEYLDLFKGVRSEQIIVDASTRYLSSAVAAEAALSYSPDARFLAIVRNPVDMFLSLHNHLYQTGIESEEVAETAWNLQWIREGSQTFRSRHPDPDSLRYSKICHLGEQIERFFRVIPRDRRKVLLLDDVKDDTAEVWRETIRFLELEEFEVDVTPRNTSFRARSRLLKQAVRSLSTLRRRIGWGPGIGLLSFFSGINRETYARPKCSDHLERQLKEHFGDDVRKLAELLGRDLSHWVASSIEESK